MTSTNSENEMCLSPASGTNSNPHVRTCPMAGLRQMENIPTPVAQAHPPHRPLETYIRATAKRSSHPCPVEMYGD